MKWTPSNSDSAPASNDASGAATQTNNNESLEQLIHSAVSEGFTELRKELAPTRRFVNPVEADTFRVPATVKRYSSLKQGIPLIGAGGDAISDMQTKTQRENVNVSSGFLVPDEFQNDLIDLREKFGVFRQNAKIVPMASDTRSDPRRVNGVTAYFVGESTAANLSDKQWDRVRMTAKKLMVLTK